MVNKSGIKVLIAAGGTGGHLFPGIAIAQEIKRRHPKASVTFAGTRRGLEAKLLPGMEWPLIIASSISIKDRKGIRRIAAWVRLPLSVALAIPLLVRERPLLLVCIGGYAAGPLALAAWILRIPFVIMEPNAIAGFTNRLLGHLAKLVFVAFDKARAYFPKKKTLLSGNPVRMEVMAVARTETSAPDKLRIFVFGGSQGAITINRAMVDAMASIGDIKDRISLLHQTGHNDDAREIERRYSEAGIKAQVFEFSNRIWECYAHADLVIARAGATTIAELFALSIPSILVPYPYAADDHQRANAMEVVQIGGAVMLTDNECTGGRLVEEITNFIRRPQLLIAMRAALSKAHRPDAARTIVEESWKLIAQR